MPVTLKRILLIANPVSGGGRAARLAERLAQTLAPDVKEARVLHTSPGDARPWLAPELSGIDLAIVVGGDGAVRQSAPLLAEFGVNLWHAPAGTQNLFARSLGMRGDDRAILKALERGVTHEIDLALATPLGMTDSKPEPFLLMASCGFDADVVSRLAAVRRGPISHFSYAAPILSTLRHFTPVGVHIECDGQALLSGQPTVGAIVANSPRYAIGLNPIPAARMDDHRLHAAILPGRSALSSLSWAVRCRFGRPPASVSAPHLRVRCERPCLWQLDGDAAPWPAVEGVEFRLSHLRVPVLLPAPNEPPGGRETRLSSLVGRS